MYQATIHPNESSSLPASPPPFIPPNYAVWVNALWFLSLVISITCALLATLLQQWARRYLKVTQPHYSPHKRARIRAFFAEGIDKFLLPWAVEALPTMLHLSLFLFFAGLVVFLWNVNLTIFKLVLSWISLCTALYGCITFIPIFRHDSPYHTPLSLPVWHFVTGIPFFTFRALEIIFAHFECYGVYSRFAPLAKRYGRLLVQGFQKTAEECAFNSPPEIDTRAFLWTFDCLDEDHELEHFFSGLPGFRSSKVVKDPLPDLTWAQQERLLQALIGLSDRTSSSDLLPELVKIWRTVICQNAIGPADIPQAIKRAFHRFTSEDQYGPVQSAEIAGLVKRWDNGEDEETTMTIRTIVSSVIARAQRRDDLWFTMASDEMSVSESCLRSHATHGNNLSLAILIHVVHQQYSLLWGRLRWPEEEFSKVLEAASKFDVLDTSPELQHEFCALWNQVVRTAYGEMLPWSILRPICNVYITLHQHTDSAPTTFSASTSDKDIILQRISTYPLCSIPGHHPDSTPQIRDTSISTANPRSVLPNNVTLVPSFLPYVPSPSVTTPVHVDENPMDMQLFDNIPSPATLNCVHKTSTESVRNSAASLDRTAAGVAQDDPSSRTMPPTTCATSMATYSVPPPAAISFLNNAAHSGAPDSLASPEQVLGDIAGPSLSLMIAFHRSPSSLESRCSILTTIHPGSSPRQTSALERSSTEGSPKAGPHEDKDALNVSSANHAVQTNTAAIPDCLSPILPLATNITAASCSQQRSDIEHAGDPSDSSRFTRPV